MDDQPAQSEMVTEPPAEFDWAVVSSLIQAQSHTTASLERYLLYVTHDDFDIPTEQVDSCIEQAITSQERAIEDLEAAQELLEQYDDD